MTAPTRPRSSPDSQPYWDGCGRGELLFQRCEACDEVVFHPRALCPYCLKNALAWRRSAGRGRVYSFSVQHLTVHPDRPPGPRVLGIAALDEGFHMFTEFLVDDPEALRIDDPIEVVFDAIAEGLILPKFKVVAS